MKDIKGIAMAQWVNHLWNNVFVNPPHYLYCVKFLEPTSSSIGFYGWQADKIDKFQNFQSWL